jgi:serine/threonine protein kinase/Tol biopolymer transport system component
VDPRYDLRRPMPIAAGSRIGPYEIVGWLGAGGMGEVYRARDPRLGREVAIKLIPESFAADPSRVRRFEQEARAAGQLNHPNILAVYDVGIHAGAPYIVSELLEGESLRRRLQGGALASRKAIDYARQTAEGLAAAHDKHIVHRDVKPDNLFITNDGRIKILDFGIAKLTRPSDDAAAHTGFHTETEAGTVLGTAGYMSPEQVRGEAVDARSDLFSVGTILYEMLAGRPPFARETAAETMAAILKEDPPQPLSTDVSPALARIVSRCLEKTLETRFQSVRDLAFALEVLSGTNTTGAPAAVMARRPRWRTALGVAVVVLSLFTALASWLPRGTSPPVDNPLPNATFTRFTNWEGTEEGAEISPDGKLVAFLADRDGEFDIWVSQVGTGIYHNLTRDIPPLASSGFIVRKLGFSADSSEIWFNPGDGKPLMLMPWTGGTPRAFLVEGANTPAWSPDGAIVYVYKPNRDDPMYLVDRTGADARQILAPGMLKNVNPVWSPDGQWIYFVRGSEPQDEMEMDVWRLRPSGGSPQRVTTQHLAMNFLAPLDSRRLLYVARGEDRSGPWLWALDVESGVSSRVPSGVDQYMSVSTSRDGRRIVATVANPSVSLWRLPLLDGSADERDALPYSLPVPTGMAQAPRFGKASLFYLSARGARDGLWTVQDGKASEVRRGVDGALSEPPAVSPDGLRLAVVVRREGKRHLSIMSADGTNPQTLAPSIEIEGAAGQGAADWSPDGTRIVTGGHDAKGPALFIIPVDTGVPVRLREGNWVNPVWSPNGDLIVYAGRSVVGQVALLGVRPDGTSIELPHVMVRPGGYRFLPNGKGLVYLPRIPSLDFWLLDFATGKSRQLTRLSNQGALRTFDITPDGKYIVFDRSRQNSNIVLIELPK